jgi:photosystem II stability/assembly factor-like uncharacterized protein
MKILSSIFVLFFITSCNRIDISGNQSTVLYPVESAQTQLSPAKVSVIYHSTDGGSTWIPFDQGVPQEATVSSFLTVDGTIYAATDDDGIYSVAAGGTQWKRVDENLPDKVEINAIASSGKVLVIGTLNHGIMISMDHGKYWKHAAVQINSPIRCLYVKQNILLAGTDHGIYMSRDHGNTWVYVWKGVQVNGFAELRNEIYAALMNGAIKTNDKGISWTYVYQSHTLHDIAADDERIYAMTLGDGLKKSADGGSTWENINDGLGSVNLYTFELKRFGNNLYAAQWYGVYVSDNLGKSWSLIKTGLPDSTAFTTLEATTNGLVTGIGARKKRQIKPR